MSRTTLLPCLVVLALTATWIEIRGASSADPAAAPDPVPAALDDLARRIERLEALRTAEPPEAPPAARTPAAPEAADGTVAAAPPKTPEEEPAASEASKAVRKLLARVTAGEAKTEDIDALWEPLLEAGAPEIAAAADAFRRRVRDHPNDADAHYGLGLVLIAQLSATKVTEMEMATLGWNADRCFTRALELDDHHFSARFSKAYCYAFWPANLGKGPEAIRHFEILATRHGGDPGREEMREVYYNLGKEYAKLGNFEKAEEWYREGLRVFPDSKAMQAELRAMEK